MTLDDPDIKLMNPNWSHAAIPTPLLENPAGFPPPFSHTEPGVEQFIFSHNTSITFTKQPANYK